MNYNDEQLARLNEGWRTLRTIWEENRQHVSVNSYNDCKLVLMGITPSGQAALYDKYGILSERKADNNFYKVDINEKKD